MTGRNCYYTLLELSTLKMISLTRPEALELMRNGMRLLVHGRGYMQWENDEYVLDISYELDSKQVAPARRNVG